MRVATIRRTPATPYSGLRKATATRPAQRWTAAALSVLAVALFALAATTLPSRLLLLSGNAVREALLAGKDVTDERLNDFIAGRERAAALRATGEILDDLSLAAFQRAQRQGLNTPQGQQDLAQALVWQRQSLGRAPANSYGWIHLARLLLQTEGPSDQAASALARSLETNPHEPRLALARLNMAVLLLDHLDKDAKARIPAMVRDNWHRNPKALAKAAQDNHYVSIVESALAEDARALNDFQALLTPVAPAKPLRSGADAKK